MTYRNDVGRKRSKLSQDHGRLALRKVGNKSALTNGPIASVGDSVLMQARLLSRSITGIYDHRLQPFGISAAQFVLLLLIDQTEPVTRADVARMQHLERSTLTRNLKTIVAAGWIEEVSDGADGRSRPLALTSAGKELLCNARPAWLQAQAQTKAVLGNDGMMAVVNVADRLAHATKHSPATAETAIDQQDTEDA